MTISNEGDPTIKLSTNPEVGVPHSGVHHDEKPFRPDENTSLQELHDLNLLPTPDHPGALAKNHNKKIALIAGGAVLAAGGFFATQLGGGKDKPKTVTTAEPSAQSTQPSTETPALRLPAEGAREYIGPIPRMQLKDFTPTFASEDSAEVLMTNFLSNYQKYAVMALSNDFETTQAIQQMLFAPGSPELGKVTNTIKADLFSWLSKHPSDAQYYTWELKEIMDGSLDQRTEKRWVVTAKILIGNTTEIENHNGAFIFNKVNVPFADQPIWVLEIERPKDSYTTPR